MKEKKWYTNLFVVCLTALAILFSGGMLVEWSFVSFCLPLLDSIANAKLFEFALWATMFALYAIISALCIVYMAVTNKSSLAVLSVRRKGSVKGLLFGALIGFAANLVGILLAAATGGIRLSYAGFSWYTLGLLPFTFIICSCEELLFRGYVFGYLKDRYSTEVAAFTGGVLFIFAHVNNMKDNGFNEFFALNIFLIGIACVLVMLYTDSIWAAFGLHTLWNFNQQYTFGLSNSGMLSTLSIFRGEYVAEGFFYNNAYGIEGSPGASVILAVAVGVLFMLYRKKKMAEQS